MGHFFEIGIKFTCNNNVSTLHALDVLNNELKESANDKNIDNYISLIFSKIIIEGKYITLYEKWTKWYEDDPQVIAIYSFIKCHTKGSVLASDEIKEELFVGCNFVNINDYDEIKYETYGNPESHIGVNLNLNEDA